MNAEIQKLEDLFSKIDMMLCGGERVEWFNQNDSIWLNVPSLDEYVVICDSEDYKIVDNTIEVQHNEEALVFSCFKVEKLNLENI